MTAPNGPPPDLAAANLRFGWWALLVFLSMGFVLEALHGFKIAAYVDVSHHIRREMWTLAHAHGALFAVLNIVFALTARSLALPSTPRLRLASLALIATGLCVPGGFFLGGLFFWGGDPGLGILLVPLGGIVGMAALYVVARAVHEKTRR